ncbi:cytochrome C biogenesis protein, partial [Campylobacter jejuni]|nr:cytochrome C biogenesis protein [Campylobacter jejuni]
NFYGSNLIPTPTQISLELFLNHYNIFDNLTPIYLLLGSMLFILLVYEILSLKKAQMLKNAIFILIALSVL